MSKSNKILYVVFSCVAFLLIGAFAVWWFDAAHIPQNFTGYARVLDVILFAMVTYVIWHPIMMVLLLWLVASNIKDTPSQVARPGLRVAFLTTFVPGSESINLLRKTLPAMIAADYPHDTWLLDEGNDPEVRALCEQLGVYHYSRHGKPHYNQDQGAKFAAKTKGGNHNSWHDMHGHGYDIVAQIDTDFIPRRDFLTKTLGYFNDPHIAWVGTPQMYGNSNESFIARGAAEQTYGFYGPFLRGMHGMDSTLLIGANHIIRTAALDSVDLYTAHITEDMFTGMKLHAKGWKSVYVHEPLTIGEGPSTWKSYFAQQMRWAYGCMDILFRHSPGLLKKMSPRRIFYYFWLQQYYFMGIGMVMGIFGLMLYFAFGIDTARLEGDGFLQAYVPVIIACIAMSLWLQQFNVRPNKERGLMFAGAVISVAAWPIFLLAFFCVLRQKRLTYKVTPKGKGLGVNRDMSVFKPHFAIGAIAASGLVLSFFTHRQDWLMMVWGYTTALTMLLLPFAEPLYKLFWRTRRTLRRIARRPMVPEEEMLNP